MEALRTPHDIGARDFAAVGVGLDTDDSDVVDCLVVHEDTFQLSGGHLEAVVFDELLDTVGDVEVAVFVLETDVAGAEPAVGRQTASRGLGVVVVAEEDVGTAHVEFTNFADLDFLRLGLVFGRCHVLGFDVGEEFSDRADALVPVLPGLGVRHGAGLAETVALLDAELEATPDDFDELAGKGSSAAVHHADTGEVVLVHDGVLAQQDHDWWRDVRECDTVLLNESAPFFEVEFGHDHRFESGIHGLVDEHVQACIWISTRHSGA